MDIGLAIALRITLLFVLVSIIGMFKEPFLSIHSKFLDGAFNIHSLIVLAGGIFIIYTSMKEIWHMMSLGHETTDDKPKGSVARIITMIILMNLVFSFDSILSAMALTDVFFVMATAIIIGGLLMIWLSEKVSNFLKKNRMYEVLGLFILFVVGIMLLTEGGHLAHLHVFHQPIVPISKTTFYFVIAIMVIVDIVQGRYQKKILLEKGGGGGATRCVA